MQSAPLRSAPPAASQRPRGAVRGAVGFLGVIVIAALIGLRVWSKVDRITGRNLVDEVMNVPAGENCNGTLQVRGRHTYTFEVTVLDGALAMAFGRVSRPNAPSESEVAAMLRDMKTVRRGATDRMTGSLDSGNYAWVVINTDEQRPAQAQVRFHAK